MGFEAHLSVVCLVTDTTFGLGFAASLVVLIILAHEALKWLRYVCSKAVGAQDTQIKGGDWIGLPGLASLESSL